MLDHEPLRVPGAGGVVARALEHGRRRVLVPARGLEVAVGSNDAPGVICRPEDRLLDPGGDTEDLRLCVDRAELDQCPGGLGDLPILAVLLAGNVRRQAPLRDEDLAQVPAECLVLEVL
jgi:hypothetical protein